MRIIFYLLLTLITLSAPFNNVSSQELLSYYTNSSFNGSIRDYEFLPSDQFAVLTDSAFYVVSSKDGSYIYQNVKINSENWKKPRLYKFNKRNYRLLISETTRKDKETQKAIWIPDSNRLVMLSEITGFNHVNFEAGVDSTTLLLTEGAENKSGAQIALLDLNSLQLKWKYVCNSNGVIVANKIKSSPVYDTLGNVFVAGSNGTLFKVRLSDGQILWSKGTLAEGGEEYTNWLQLLEGKGNQLVKCSNGVIQVLNSSDGTLVSTIYADEFRKAYRVKNHNDTLLIWSISAGKTNSFIRAFNASGRPLWKESYKLRAFPRLVVRSNDILYIVSSSSPGGLDGLTSVYGISLKDGLEAIKDVKIAGSLNYAYMRKGKCVVITSSRVATVSDKGEVYSPKELSKSGEWGRIIVDFDSGYVYSYIPGRKFLLRSDSMFHKVDSLLLPNDSLFNNKEVFFRIEHKENEIRLIGYQSMVCIDETTKRLLFKTPFYQTVTNKELVGATVGLNILGALLGSVYIPYGPYAYAHLATVNTENEHMCVSKDPKTKKPTLVITDKKIGKIISYIPYSYNSLRFGLDTSTRRIAMLPYPNSVAFYFY